MLASSGHGEGVWGSRRGGSDDGESSVSVSRVEQLGVLIRKAARLEALALAAGSGDEEGDAGGNAEVVRRRGQARQAPPGYRGTRSYADTVTLLRAAAARRAEDRRREEEDDLDMVVEDEKQRAARAREKRKKAVARRRSEPLVAAHLD